jgi:SAM-dependent methyltransferase
MFGPARYWAMRLLRRATPRQVIDFMLDRGIYLKPSFDTSEPKRRARLYADRAAAHGIEIDGAAVCVVGYGGSVGIGLALVELGAGAVVLQDPFAPRRAARDAAISAIPSQIERVHQHLGELVAERGRFADLVVSNSVLEHVVDPDGVIGACADAARPGGLNVHFIDLRDHYFRYPFEMLCYSEETWRRYLNASNNLNRLRMPDFERLFAAAFADVEIEVVDRLVDEFRRAKPRIRHEFLSGDEGIDAAAIIRVEARGGRP